MDQIDYGAVLPPSLMVFFLVGGRDGWTGIEGTLRGPRGPKKAKLNCSRQSGRLFEQDHVGMTRGKAQKSST